MDTTTTRKRRPKRSAAEWHAVAKDWLASGLSPEEYAERHNLSLPTLQRWSARLGVGMSRPGRGRRRAASPGAAVTSFVPVRLVHRTPVLAEQPEGRIEVALANGRAVRVFGRVCEETLALVLRAVEGRSAC